MMGLDWKAHLEGQVSSAESGWRTCVATFNGTYLYLRTVLDAFNKINGFACIPYCNITAPRVLRRL